ncbi:MAG: imidazolonepropionase [Bacteroidia bacterium]
MSLIIHNLSRIVHTEEKPVLRYNGAEMSALQIKTGTAIFIKDGLINQLFEDSEQSINTIRQQHPGVILLDARGGSAFPAWVDAHTHIVYDGNRDGEFVDRIKGLSYEEIFSRGGGILNSAAKLRQANEESLFEQAMHRLKEIITLGTGAVEIKSGYGLSVESELKMLRVIQKLKANSPLTIKATFLGAHAFPAEFKNDKAGYLKVLITDLIPEIGRQKLAEYCDIFVEQNYFTYDDACRLFEAAVKAGLRPKVHAEQLSHSGGIKAGVKYNAVSVDHLEFASAEDIQLLAGSDTVPVLLPGAQLFLGLQNPPARKMIEAGLPVALSSDFNPGSCPSGNMNQMVSLACILYKMTPEEAIIAATTNSAAAIELSHSHGSICEGKAANIFITEKIPSAAFLPYSFGSNLIEKVILNGVLVHSRNS